MVLWMEWRLMGAQADMLLMDFARVRWLRRTAHETWAFWSKFKQLHAMNVDILLLELRSRFIEGDMI